MRRSRRYSLVLLAALLCTMFFHFLLLLSRAAEDRGSGAELGGATSGCHQPPLGQLGSNRYENLTKRPLLVRFKWYSRKRTPTHLGYAGSTAMAILKPYGFVETTSDDWDLLWTMVPQWHSLHTASTPDLPRPWQRHNHCLSLTNNRGISGAKVSQWKLYKCMRDAHGSKLFSYMPDSLILPDEAPKLEEILNTDHSPWIVKLSMGKRAMGIKLVTDARDIPRGKEQYIAQRYIADPLLLDGRKFHLRLYLVITNMQPLRALLHREGLVLFASRNYSRDPSTFSDLNVHLTNAAVAEQAAGGGGGRGGKRRAENSMLLSDLWRHLAARKKVDAKKVWQEIKQVAAKLVLSEMCDRPQEIGPPAGSCFDVIGLDVLLDSGLRAHVLECNNGPELYTLEEQVRTRRANDLAHRAMLRDLIPLVMMQHTPTREDFESFDKRLKSLDVKWCGEKEGLGGDCWRQVDSENLWRQHYEDRHMGSFERVLPGFELGKSQAIPT